jgi:hypothetical protein
LRKKWQTCCPDLVVRDELGRPETVQYQKLEPMLLNELQRLHRQVQELAAEVGALRERLAARER